MKYEHICICSHIKTITPAIIMKLSSTFFLFCSCFLISGIFGGNPVTSIEGLKSEIENIFERNASLSRESLMNELTDTVSDESVQLVLFGVASRLDRASFTTIQDLGHGVEVEFVRTNAYVFANVTYQGCEEVLASHRFYLPKGAPRDGMQLKFLQILLYFQMFRVLLAAVISFVELINDENVNVNEFINTTTISMIFLMVSSYILNRTRR
jgi:hypothetical protein